jgi:hypothetical protein
MIISGVLSKRFHGPRKSAGSRLTVGNIGLRKCFASTRSEIPSLHGGNLRLGLSPRKIFRKEPLQLTVRTIVSMIIINSPKEKVQAHSTDLIVLVKHHLSLSEELHLLTIAYLKLRNFLILDQLLTEH